MLFTIGMLLVAWLLAGKNTFGVVNLGERFLIVALMLMILHFHCPEWIRKIWQSVCIAAAIGTLCCLVVLSRETGVYTADRSAGASELESYVEDIYKNSRHKYFNHRLFIYANLGQYLVSPAKFDGPPAIDHESSIVRMIKNGASGE